MLSQSLTPHLSTPRVCRLSPNEDWEAGRGRTLAGRGGPWPAVSVWHPAGTQQMRAPFSLGPRWQFKG